MNAYLLEVCTKIFKDEMAVAWLKVMHMEKDRLGAEARYCSSPFVFYIFIVKDKTQGLKNTSVVSLGPTAGTSHYCLDGRKTKPNQE